MNTQELLDHLEKSGVDLWLDRGQLQLRGPLAALSSSIRDDLKRCKEQIVAHVASRGAKNGSVLSSPQRSLL
ncbi:MAG TPA: hypothetical protein VK629_08970, partial [Steroidobacteraceae bacterium]|nr:hypothetical protein [Steroidobacteraceae bacterium]